MDLPNIVFIVVDTLRDDYSLPLKRELGKLGFVSYENVIAPASWTTPSHASMFTGVYPAVHGAHETKIRKDIGVKLNTGSLLSLELMELGYKTYLLSANPYVRPEFGFAGFDHFYDSLYLPTFSLLSVSDRKQLDTLEKLGITTQHEIVKHLLLNRHFILLVKAGLNSFVNNLYTRMYAVRRTWPKDKGVRHLLQEMTSVIKSIGKTQNFVFINLMEVHEPYFIGDDLGGEGFRKNLRKNMLDHHLVQKWKEKYPEEVAYVTKRILDMMNVLKENGVFDDSLIIVVSDHGQLLGEHGRISHGTFLYDELLRVPLLVKYPKGYDVELIGRNLDGEMLGYISLTKLKSFILGLVDNRFSDDSVLYDDVVFAESYGIHQNVGNPRNEEERKNIEELEKYRIAVYYKNFKGIFNVTDWKFEEIKSYDPSIEVTEDVVKQLKKEVLRFLKTATVAKVPKVNV